MKIQSTRLLLATLLLGILTLTPAAFATPPNATPAVEAPASPGAGCTASLQTLDFLKLTPTSPQARTATCGACSTDGCAGAFINQVCHYGRFGSQTGSCQAVLGNDCPGTTTLACQCWSGPLP